MALKSFKHLDVTSVGQATSNLAKYKEKAKLVAGGTDLLGVLKDNIHPNYPEFLLNIKTISGLDYIIEDKDGLRIGALTKLCDIEKTNVIKKKYKVLAEAVRSVASFQIRNMGTLGGNICQEPRCWYYRNPENMFYCIRKGGKICNALTGDNRYHSIFGAARVINPPCTSNCPGQVKIASYLSKIREGELQEAAKILLDCNPIPAITGRVCPHFCEEDCNRGEFDESVSIRSIERFMGDYILKNSSKIVKPTKKNTGKKVAIIGSGPAGLTAAYYLANVGHSVTIFEQFSKAGGMMRVGIPHYRLPSEVLDFEVEKILKVGIELKPNTKIESIGPLFNQGYDAVFLALGAHRGIKMGIGGEDTEGVIDGASFLKDVSSGKKMRIGENIAVVGGGNVAIDSARTALRLGAKKVSIIYRRTRDEMPASNEEIEGALEEGIELVFLVTPVKVERNGNNLILTCVQMELGEPDASGRRRPKPVQGSEFALEFDNLITAIGQLPEIPANFGLEIEGGNTIRVNPDTLATTRERVWAGGDVATGPATVIEAIAAGKKAAASINLYLNGPEAKSVDEETTNLFGRFNSTCLSKTNRIRVSELPISKRISDSEVVLSLEMNEIEAEANRCFNCGCAAVSASDIAPALMALEAKIKTSKRTIEAEDFFTAGLMKTTVLDSDELVEEILIPASKNESKQSYLKFRIRNSIDFPIVSVASVFSVDSERINDAKIVLGAVAPVPIRIREAEKFLRGKVPCEEVAQEAGNIAVKRAIPLSKNEYKVQLIRAFIRKAVLNASSYKSQF